jgi:hypothetical protein
MSAGQEVLAWLLATVAFWAYLWTIGAWVLAASRNGAEVMDFEPSEQFEMPEAMGIDYIPGHDDNNHKEN